MARAIPLRALLQTFPRDLLAEYFRSRGLDLALDWARAGDSALSGVVGRLPELARRHTRHDLSLATRLADDSAAVSALDAALREHFSWDDLPADSSAAARVLWALMHDPEALRRARKMARASKGEGASTQGVGIAPGSGFQFTVTYIPEQNLFTAQGAVQPANIIAFPGAHDRRDVVAGRVSSSPALTEVELDCLQALAASPQRPMSQVEVMAAGGYSKGTTCTALARLRELGFIVRPAGTKRKGDTITPLGLAFIKRQERAARAS